MLSDAAKLLRWYDRNRRALPWRQGVGGAPDPYRVWLSEIMLQQTTTRAVAPYYERFCARFPNVEALARAEERDVLALWAGLGYYARARNLSRAARIIARTGFPRAVPELRSLPGVGAYTAAAIAAIAFGDPIVPIDANVARIIARRTAITEPLPRGMARIAEAARALGAAPAARSRPGDFAQALFDLGATICTPRAPRCAVCPWRAGCAAYRMGIAEALPTRAARKARPERYGAHFWLTDAKGNVLLRRRPDRGPLAGMTEFPGTAWRAEPWPRAAALAEAPMRARWRAVGEVRHGFTHFSLSIALYAARVKKITAPGMLCARRDLGREALPSLMRKCVRLMER